MRVLEEGTSRYLVSRIEGTRRGNYILFRVLRVLEEGTSRYLVERTRRYVDTNIGRKGQRVGRGRNKTPYRELPVHKPGEAVTPPKLKH